jgi:D-alanine-D-alanine ligase
MRIAVIHDEAPPRRACDDIRATVAAVTDVLRRAGHEVRGGDLVFNLCESPETEAAAVTNLDVPFTGSGPEALALCLDKARTKQALAARGIRVPGTGFPAIVKPARQDASIGIDFDSVVRNPAELERALARLGEPAIVEEFIDGREFNVGIVGDEPLPVSEIEFSGLPARIVTYAGKWVPGSPDDRGTTPVCPARISSRLRDRLWAVTRQCVDILGVRGYARVDFRMDARDRLYVLEVNPNPDLSPDAGLARQAAAAGWSYDELILRIVGR